ncbi:AAA family ATPase [Riemerella anatipestifer]|uniref:helix-turn-helix domain-containing protein n=1 Tax=Riemerella anatipestifer TaxID=34085 RepID=UPI0023649C3B|nr:helix-turn-helix domain-containing protein [Riemerella anatipestifer]MDD1597626.1 AAA family ATPase [Riemerella anatipestifer]
MNSEVFQLIEHTNRNIFLTGKAGTGKTTFLNYFVKNTKKSHIVVAPTGIAAINAGGVTIHSMFGLPLRPFFPTTERIDSHLGNNIPDLVKHFKYRSSKLKLLREVEIIIIDEVSMLRADVLDMMDFSLRHIRRNGLPFGGVQMLFIGDLYQLPPVVRDEHSLQRYYTSPFFFSAHALRGIDLVTVELTKVYRQQDETFLNILNEIREGNLSEDNYEKLNSRYISDFDPKDETYVYLTSHNRMADSINRERLEALGGRSYFYRAEVRDDFNEHQYPNEEILELKVGAQVMFIRNDASPEKRYFNGKLAEVTALDQDEIRVIIDGEDEEFTIKHELWEQKRYFLDKDKNIREEVLGSFKQYPIRLAWAVTIHKSQGLTFDRLIVDAGQSFASGQVYVALSRCRTLEGIVLKSQISKAVIFNDQRVAEFQKETNANDRISEIIKSEKHDYSVGKVLRRIDCNWFTKALEEWYNQALVTRDLDKNKAKKIYLSVKPQIENWVKIFEKLERVLKQKTQKFIKGDEQWDEIEAKAKGAVNYFFTQTLEHFFTPFKDFYAETKGVKGLKTYNAEIKLLLDDLEDYLNDLKSVFLIDTPLFDETNEKSITTEIKKVPTHVLTYQLFEDGKTIGEIAKERGLVISTVYGHLAKFAEQGLLDLSRLISAEKIKTFEETFKQAPQGTLSEWKKVLPDDFEYHEIRLLDNHYRYLEHKEED